MGVCAARTSTVRRRLTTDLAKLRGLGLKPLLVGLVAAACVGLVSSASLSVLAAL